METRMRTAKAQDLAKTIMDMFVRTVCLVYSRIPEVSQRSLQ
jgi:hypothetical protein